MNDFPNWPRNPGWAGAGPTGSAGAGRADDCAAASSLWPDDGAPAIGRGIVGSPSPSARGLSVEQHAARVLMHLLAERDSA